jgi:hypothetical protein
MKTALNLPYSPGIAPSDFYLFGYVNGCLAGHPFLYEEGLFVAIRGVLGSIEK